MNVRSFVVRLLQVRNRSHSCRSALGDRLPHECQVLDGREPELRRHLYTEDGKLRAFVNVYVNDEDIRYLQKENTPVNDNDTVSIVPSIAGGEERV